MSPKSGCPADDIKHFFIVSAELQWQAEYISGSHSWVLRGI
jgi:hypothetical protein